MTVKGLIKKLSKLDPSLRVILARDSEGNDFSPAVESLSTGRYNPRCTWAGSIEDSKTPNAVVLWPTN